MEEVPSSQARANIPAEERGLYAPGDLIAGKFKLRSLLGEGGMGSVWVAQNVVLDIDVAIKLIRHGIASPEASERLLQEARAAARLEHPSIVRVFDFGSTDAGDPFIAMELLRGQSLAQLIDRRGRMSAQQAVCTLLPVISAVAAAHAKGIVHRDLKPDNILLADNDTGVTTPKVVDFGIAKVRPIGAAYRTITHVGAILGSPDYMSPEQARGKRDVGEKCDVWAMSIILYECLTGQRPFSADNYNALITSIIEDAPVPTTDLAGGDEALWQIVKTGLTKAPAERPTMREFGETLARWAFESGADTDVTGASLAQWMVRTSSRPFDEIATPGPARLPSVRRTPVRTASDLEPVADGKRVVAGHTGDPAEAGATNRGTRSEWSSTPPTGTDAARVSRADLAGRQPFGKTARLGFGVLLVGALATGFVVLKRSATPPVAVPAEGTLKTAAPPPTTPAAEEQPVVAPAATTAMPAGAPTGSAATASATTSPAATATAHVGEQHATSKGGSTKKPPTKGAPGLAVPDRPNF